jgi:chorismate lyase/3-hydroxybenzoate synthase
LREPAFDGTTLALRIPSPQLLQPLVPQWASDAVADGRLENFTAIVSDAALMDAAALQAGVTAAYAQLGARLHAARKAPIRLWNYLPDPGHPMGPGLDRYMVFNAGRFDGYRLWPDGGLTGPSLATASAVGIVGQDLTIHCLASPDGGVAIENPRQTPAWRYSARYGPVPPCFSRATVAEINGRRQLLIGGTASIVGEDSRHAKETGAQLEELLTNLAALTPLGRLVDLRCYVVSPDDGAPIATALRLRCPAARLELTVARLCRPELLVEVEGVADL